MSDLSFRFTGQMIPARADISVRVRWPSGQSTLAVEAWGVFEELENYEPTGYREVRALVIGESGLQDVGELGVERLGPFTPEADEVARIRKSIEPAA